MSYWDEEDAPRLLPDLVATPLSRSPIDMNHIQTAMQQPGDVPPEGSSGGGSSSSGGSDADKRKSDIVNGIIIPGYRDILGRAPDQSEIDEAYSLYESKGGDAFRDALRARLGNKPGGGSSGYQDSKPSLPTSGPAPKPLQPWTETFTAPTMEQALNEPGFQFQLGEGLKTLQRSAASRGTLLTGGTQKGLIGYANDLANTNYQNVYNRAYNEYDTRRTNFLTNEANRYTSERSNRLDDWGISSDYFNMGRANRLDDFNIWNTIDMNTFMKLLQLAQLKKPPSPSSLGY